MNRGVFLLFMHKCTLGDRFEELLILFYQDCTRAIGCKLLAIRVVQPGAVAGRILAQVRRETRNPAVGGVLPWLDSLTLVSLPTMASCSSPGSPPWHSCSSGCRPLRTPIRTNRWGTKAT